MLRSTTFLTFVLTFVTFSLCLGCTYNYYPEGGECDEHSDDGGNDGPIEEPTDDDDDSASGDDDDSSHNELPLIYLGNDEDERLYSRSSTNATLFTLYFQIENQPLVLDRLEFEIRSDSDADLGNGIDDDIDIQDRFAEFRLMYGGQSYPAEIQGNRVEFIGLDLQLLPGLIDSFGLVCDMSNEVMGNSYFAAVLEEIELFHVDDDPINPDQVVMLDFLQGPVEEELNSSFTDHIGVANTRLDVSSWDNDDSMALADWNQVLGFSLTTHPSGGAEQYLVPFTLELSDYDGQGWADCSRLADEERFSLWEVAPDGEYTRIYIELDFLTSGMVDCSMAPDQEVGYVVAMFDREIESSSYSNFQLHMDCQGASMDLGDTLQVNIDWVDEFHWVDQFGQEYDGQDTFGIPVYGPQLTFYHGS